jgi:hypothetical protein
MGTQFASALILKLSGVDERKDGGNACNFEFAKHKLRKSLGSNSKLGKDARGPIIIGSSLLS